MGPSAGAHPRFCCQGKGPRVKQVWEGNRRQKRERVLRDIYLNVWRRLVQDPGGTLQGTQWRVDGHVMCYSSYVICAHVTHRYVQKLV